MSFEETQAILDAGAMQAFIGLEENLSFEAKRSSPYDLKTESGRYELAKDASAFANAAGGHIVIGLITTRSDNEATDKVASLDLAQEQLFPTGTVIGVLRDYIYPPMTDLSVKWIPDATSGSIGVVAITIPKQLEDRKPFLIKRLVEDESAIKQIVFGYAKRTGPDAIPHTVENLHKAMVSGMNTVAQRLTTMEAKLTALLEMNAQVQGAALTNAETDELRARIRARVQAAFNS